MGTLKKRIGLKLGAAIGGFAASAVAFGWNDSGHMIVAAIAWDDLTPRSRTQIEILLRGDSDPKTNIFLTSACWADDKKDATSAPWHFINHHFRQDGKPSANKPASENAVSAISKFSLVLGDKSGDRQARRDALKYLVHLVADLHQPLHCVSRDTEQHPNGDRGGNDFKIAPPSGLVPAPQSLHHLWDMGGGLFPTIERPLSNSAFARLQTLAGQIKQVHPKRAMSVEELAPAAWAKEGLSVAQNLVYNLEPNAKPSPIYLVLVQSESSRQAAVAGYRLAALLNRLL